MNAKPNSHRLIAAFQACHLCPVPDIDPENRRSLSLVRAGKIPVELSAISSRRMQLSYHCQKTVTREVPRHYFGTLRRTHGLPISCLPFVDSSDGWADDIYVSSQLGDLRRCGWRNLTIRRIGLLRKTQPDFRKCWNRRLTRTGGNCCKVCWWRNRKRSRPPRKCPL